MPSRAFLSGDVIPAARDGSAAAGEAGKADPARKRGPRVVFSHVDIRAPNANNDAPGAPLSAFSRL
jgi:hypothetical protein